LLGIVLLVDVVVVLWAKAADVMAPSGFAIWAAVVLFLAGTSGAVAEIGLRRWFALRHGTHTELGHC
jgi:hypothetical protein